ncbi:uncharacterized protein LOC134273396 [Saccostrea cucullata]|uniref:uncharacterized protein LOC134273396 n=1 Tax=Saccostrea cuccullata TaxID=36930 RepID=UPI002ED2D43D
MDLWNVHEIDDVTLSQIADFIEAESNFENLSFSENDFLDIDIDFGDFDALPMENITSSDVNTMMVDLKSSTDQACDIKTGSSKIKVDTENSDVKLCPSRFGDLKEEEDINRLIKDTESKNTRKNSNWSKKTFDEWREFRTSQTNVPIPEIENFKENDVNVWMNKFVLEARRKDGAPLSARMAELTKQGVGTVSRQADPISRDNEEELWSKGVFGS